VAAPKAATAAASRWPCLDKRTRGGFGRYTSSSAGKKFMRGRKIDEGGSGGSFIAGGERKKEGGGLGRQSRGGWDGAVRRLWRRGV
jgi:hypothetical protein